MNIEVDGVKYVKALPMTQTIPEIRKKNAMKTGNNKSNNDYENGGHNEHSFAFE
ncbi:hypothetical protein SK128_010448, partial [Halocaridina rubra]